MPDDTQYKQDRLYLLDKIEHFKQENRQLKCDIEKLQAAIHKQEVEYAREMNELKGQITNLENASKTFPTRESVDIRLRTLEGHQDKMKGQVMAYASVAAFLVSVGTVLAYAYM